MLICEVRTLIFEVCELSYISTHFVIIPYYLSVCRQQEIWSKWRILVNDLLFRLILLLLQTITCLHGCVCFLKFLFICSDCIRFRVKLIFSYLLLCLASKREIDIQSSSETASM